MRFLLIFLLMLPLAVDAQEWQLLSLSGFPGMNTATSDMARRPSEAIVSINLDYSRYGVGSFGKRFGYDSVSFLAGQDEVIGLNAVYLSDFTQYLGTVWDSAGVGYGGIYVSPLGEAHFTGTQTFKFAIHDVLANYAYTDSFFFSGDTVVAVYTSDGDPTGPEIQQGLVDLIDTLTGLDGFFTPEIIPFVGYNVFEAVEFLSSSAASDTGQTITTTTTGLTGKIWDFFSIQNRPSFAQFNDEWFVVNGAQKGVRYNGKVARSWPPNAPGEPSIIPLSDAGGLDGEYLYTFRVGSSESADSLTSNGYVSAPVRVKAGQIMLKDFIWPATDSTDTGLDTVLIFGYRTRANPGPIDEGDYAFFFDTIAFDTIQSELEAIIYIDSLADEALSSTDSVKLVQSDWVGRDSTGAIDVRYGAPGFLDIPVWVNDPANSVFAGIPDQVDTLGVAYRLVRIDTINGDESGGSSICYVWVDTDSTTGGTQKPGHIRLGLPSLGDTALVYNLYRAQILHTTYDSAFLLIDSLKNVITQGDVPSILEAVKDVVLVAPFRKWGNAIAFDSTILSEFRLVAQIASDSSAYTDSASYDSLQTQPIFRGAIPPLLSGVFSHDNFLWGWDGSFLVWSDLDSAGNWGAFNRIAVNRDDGDAITVCFATRSGIAILKNFSRWNLYDQNTKIEKVGDWGCIAPRSYAAAENGHFYLSARGVIFETEGLQLERTVVAGLVSTKLRNFDIMSIETKSTAVGRWDPVAGQYRMTIGDSVYVFDKVASDLLGEEVWGIWTGLTFTDATLYNTEDELEFLPGDDFYFIQDGSSNLFLYGDSETDPGSIKITFEWENANMLADPGWKSEIMQIGIRGEADTASDSLLLRVLDESATETVATTFYDSLTQFYRGRDLSTNLSLEHSIEIRSIVQFPFLIGHIDRIDIWYEPRVEPVTFK